MGAISTIMEKLVENATNFVCNKFKKVLTTKELRNKFIIFSYEYFKTKFENCDLSDGFDFEAVETYLYNNLDNKIISIFHEIKNIGLEGQDRIRENILKEAIEYCKGNSSNEKAIRKYCNAIIDFVGDILYDKILDSDKLLAAEITSVINEHYKHLDNKIDEIKDIEQRNMSKIEYLSSFAKQIDNMGMPKVITINEFSYTNPNIGFYGRKTEQEEIEKFMNDNRSVLFWSVIGRGGVGKSKFALYICQKYEHQNWKSVWLNRKSQINSLNQIAGCREYYKNLLIICDYAGIFIESIKDILLSFPYNARYKIRVLLLERSGFNQLSQDNCFTHFDMWHDRLLSGYNSAELKEIEYCTDPLNLNNYVLNNEDMCSILDDFSGGKLSTNDKNEIVDFVKNKLNSSSDKNSQSHSEERCLFLLFTADAFLHGNNYKDWDIKVLIEQYIERFKTNIEAHFDLKACKNAYILLSIATAVGRINIENVDLDGVFKYFVIPIKDSLNYNIDINELKMFLSVLCEKDTADLNIEPMLPDLVGEFFFIDTFHKISPEYKREWYKVFCSEKYHNHFCNFLKRCLNDWHSLKNFQGIIKELLEFAVDNNFNGFVEECVNNSFFMGLSYYYRLNVQDLLWIEAILLTKKNKNWYTEYAITISIATFKIPSADDILELANKIKSEILLVFNTDEIAEQYVSSLLYASMKTDNLDKILTITDIIKDEVLNLHYTNEIVVVYTKIFYEALFRINGYNDVILILNLVTDNIINKYANTIEIMEQYAEILKIAVTRINEICLKIEVLDKFKREILSKYNTDAIKKAYAYACINIAVRIEDTDETVSFARRINQELSYEFINYMQASHYSQILSKATDKITEKKEMLFLLRIIRELFLVFGESEWSDCANDYATALGNLSSMVDDTEFIRCIAETMENEILSNIQFDMFKDTKPFSFYGNEFYRKKDYKNKSYRNELLEQYAIILANLTLSTDMFNERIKIYYKIRNYTSNNFICSNFANTYVSNLVFILHKKYEHADAILEISRNIIKNEILYFFYGAKVVESYALSFLIAVIKISEFTRILEIADQVKSEIIFKFPTPSIMNTYASILISAGIVVSSMKDLLVITDKMDKEVLVNYCNDEIAINYTSLLCYITCKIVGVDNLLIIAKKVNDVLKMYKFESANSKCEVAHVYACILKYILKLDPQNEQIANESKNIIEKYNISFDDVPDISDLKEYDF